MSHSTRPPSPNVKPRHQPVLCGSYSRLELAVVQQLKAKDLQKCLAHCQDVNLNERRAGLCNLLIYLRRDDTRMTEGDVLQVRETLKRFFPERNSKLYRLFLEVLHDFFQLYCEQLEGWVELVLRRLLDRLGSETLPTLKSLIKRTVSSLQHCYIPGFLFRIAARIISRNQSIAHKAQLASLDYLGDLLPLLQPEDFFEHSDLEACLKTLATDLSTTNAPMRIKIQDVLSVLFDLNPTTFNMFLSRLPVKLEDSLTRSIRRHWAKVIENEHLSPRKTFRAPPEEDLRGALQGKRELIKQKSLTDLMQFPSDSDEQLHSSTEDILSQSCSANVFGKKLAPSPLTHSLAVQQTYGAQPPPPPEASLPLIPPLDVLPPIPTYPPPDVPHSPPNIPTTLPPDIPCSPPNLPTTLPPDVPNSPPPALPTTSPPEMPSQLSIDSPSSPPPDVPTTSPPAISPEKTTFPLPGIHTALPMPCVTSQTSHNITNTPGKSLHTPSRIPVSVRTCPRLSTSERSKLFKISSEHKNKRCVTLSPTLITGVSSPLFVLRTKTEIKCNPRTYGNTPSKIPRFTGNAARSIPDSTSGRDGETPLGDSVSSSDGSDKASAKRKGRRSRVCLEFGDKSSTQGDSPGKFTRNDHETNIRCKEIKRVKSTSIETPVEADSAAATNSSSPSKSVHSTSIGSSLHLIPSESLEEDSSAQIHSHSCHELRTESAASLDSEGEVRLSSPPHSLKQLLSSFLSSDDQETKVQAVNDLREILLTHTLIPLRTDSLHPALSQVVTELISFSARVPERTQLVSLHTLYLLSQLAAGTLFEHSGTLARFFLVAHAAASQPVRIKLESLFLIFAQTLDLSLVISLITDDLLSVTINYLTPLKLLAKLIPHTPTHILDFHLPKLVPEIIKAYTGRVGIQNAALPCLVGMYNCLDSQIDSYLEKLSPAQEKLLMMYVKSSKKREI